MKMAVVFILMLVSLPTFAQSNYAELSGTVLDPERAAIVGASIQLTSVSTHQRNAAAMSTGSFRFPVCSLGSTN